eukprot:4134332-Prymnesium_polylepis.1
MARPAAKRSADTGTRELMMAATEPSHGTASSVLQAVRYQETPCIIHSQPLICSSTMLSARWPSTSGDRLPSHGSVAAPYARAVPSSFDRQRAPGGAASKDMEMRSRGGRCSMVAAGTPSATTSMLRTSTTCRRTLSCRSGGSSPQPRARLSRSCRSADETHSGALTQSVGRDRRAAESSSATPRRCAHHAFRATLAPAIAATSPSSSAPSTAVLASATSAKAPSSIDITGSVMAILAVQTSALASRV